jgi:hypothetical protein
MTLFSPENVPLSTLSLHKRYVWLDKPPKLLILMEPTGGFEPPTY